MDEKKDNDMKIPETDASAEPVISAAAEVSLEFEENPYDPENKRPEDIVRLFYVYDIPVIPVASKRGIILGVLHKADVISELSDIERVEKSKIDKFVTRLARKTTLDQILKFSHIHEFVVINLFGEVQGKWSRIQLFNAIESYSPDMGGDETEKSRDEHVLEWMIYLILEHIPRGLYAVNAEGRTIFYNSIFEDLYTRKYKSEVDPALVEAALKDPDKNELVSDGSGASIHFFNTELNLRYERTPLMSKGHRAGYLIFVNDDSNSINQAGDNFIPGEGESLEEAVSHFERQLIVRTLKEVSNVSDAAKLLKTNRRSLITKISRLGIDLNE